MTKDELVEKLEQLHKEDVTSNKYYRGPVYDKIINELLAYINDDTVTEKVNIAREYLPK